MKATEASIQYILGRHYGINRSNIIIPNIRMDYGRYEADLILINKNQFLIEMEIKISFSDFKADFMKKNFHNNSKLRGLYYVFPHELWLKYQNRIREMVIEVGAGIITVHNYDVYVQRKPKWKDVKPLTKEEVAHYMRLGCLKWIRKWGETNECRG